MFSTGLKTLWAPLDSPGEFQGVGVFFFEWRTIQDVFHEVNQLG
jgi:hypothetical protein